MTQSELLNQLKFNINQFPRFLQNFLKKPLGYIDFEPQFDWVKVLLFGYMTHALSSTVMNIGTLNFAGLIPGLIFVPIQALVIVGFISFAIWFALDRMGFGKLDYQAIFKLLLFSELMVTVFAVPVFLVLRYLKTVEFGLIFSILIVLVKCYLLFRGFTKQLNLSNKRSLGVVAVYALIFLNTPISAYFNDYELRHQARKSFKINEKQMEESIRALEKDLSE